MDSRMDKYKQDTVKRGTRSARNEELYYKNQNPFEEVDSSFTFDWEKEFLITEENYPKKRSARRELFDLASLSDLPRREPVNIDEIQYHSPVGDETHFKVDKTEEEKIETLTNTISNTSKRNQIQSVKKEEHQKTVKEQEMATNPDRKKETPPKVDVPKENHATEKKIEVKPKTVKKVEEVFPMMTAEEKERRNNLNIKIIVGMIFLINTIIIVCLIIMAMYL